MKKIFVCSTRDISEQHPYRFHLARGEQVVIFQTAEGYFAVENRCPHAGAYLHEGSVQHKVLTCPWHGWRFDLESGQSLTEYRARLKTYPLQIVEEKIYLIQKEET